MGIPRLMLPANELVMLSILYKGSGSDIATGHLSVERVVDDTEGRDSDILSNAYRSLEACCYPHLLQIHCDFLNVSHVDVTIGRS